MNHTQGAVPLRHETYVARQFETDLVREVMAGRWVLLLGPRQHGKTTALIRLRETLGEAGMTVALVDLQMAPPPTTYDDLLQWFCRKVQEQVHAQAGPGPLPGHDLGTMLAHALPSENSPVTVLIDEASNIKDAGWRNSFYGQLRAISSRRAIAPPGDAAARLRFVFAGTFSPETLIEELNSPFNVCERIDTEDFTREQVITLGEALLGPGREELTTSVYDEVGGQPYLVQRLLGIVQAADDQSDRLRAEIDKLRSGQSDHVEHLFGKVLAEPELAGIATSMVADGAAPIEAGRPAYRHLQVLGLARRDGSKLVFRNTLYANVAATSPQLGGHADAGVRVPMFPLPVGAFAKVADARLREMAWTQYNGAVAAYRGGGNRLALAGFGSSLEAMLLDVMLRQPAGSLPALLASVNVTMSANKANDPKTWSLFQLIKAASGLSAFAADAPPQALREWRNTIHPAVCLDDYRPDRELEVEARLAATLHELALRNLP